VRELSHVIERAVLWSRGPTLDPEHLSLMSPLEPPAGEPVANATVSTSGSATAPAQPPATPSNTGEAPALPPPGTDLEGWERAMIEQALREAAGNQTRAALRLGISRDTLRYRLKKYGIQG
jgi:two-component system, NtrC family, response regulator AtoC